MRTLLVILALVLPAEVASESPAKGWTLSGWLLAEGSHDANGAHTPIVGQEVLLRRLWHPWWCVFCLGGYVDYASATTGERGQFNFSGKRRGWYEMVVRCPTDSVLGFAARAKLDELRRGEYHAYLEYSTRHCD